MGQDCREIADFPRCRALARPFQRQNSSILEPSEAFCYAQDESPVQHQASAKNVEALRQALMQA